MLNFSKSLSPAQIELSGGSGSDIRDSQKQERRVNLCLDAWLCLTSRCWLHGGRSETKGVKPEPDCES